MSKFMVRASLLLLSTPSLCAAAAQIPLCPGLTIVTAVNQMAGDYESIKTVETLGARELRLKYSSEAVDNGMFGTGKVVHTTLYRKLLLEDLRAATRYEQVFARDSDELLPGTTAIGTSTAVLRALKSTGEATLAVSNVPGGIPLLAKPASGPSAYDYFNTAKIQRVGIVNVPMLVNDKLVELTAVHAKGEYFGDHHEFFFLDDDANPMTLKFRLGVGGIKPMAPEMAEACKVAADNKIDLGSWRSQCMPNGGDRDALQVVKISHRCPVALPQTGDGGAGSGALALEQALQKSGKADIYSIYFGFDSDKIRDESKPTLEDIATVMRKHPDWQLSIHGHTDNVASDKYNLQLSQRRAAAVTQALISGHGIAAGRLGASGHGEASPKDTNDTLEGRARNRRVELVRLP